MQKEINAASATLSRTDRVTDEKIFKVGMYVCMYVGIYVGMYVGMYVCMYVCMYVRHLAVI